MLWLSYRQATNYRLYDNELKSGGKKKVTASNTKTTQKSKFSLPAGIFKVTSHKPIDPRGGRKTDSNGAGGSSLLSG